MDQPFHRCDINCSWCLVDCLISFSEENYVISNEYEKSLDPSCHSGLDPESIIPFH